ncbi:hypothetical protein [Cupriavidus sp. USMAA2-4]|uniref:hypothetical protein n=1 Tax=Cupriavidus sp. USMAA2-4 TaxID=876364 RepID=UPI0012F4B0B1|nr:hypothetical protein [Cupriavidus sp. USMAA2-4]
MSVETWGWRAVTLCAAVAVGLFACLVTTLVGMDSGQNQVAAAWVQAAGSVAAIVTAIFVANAQHRAAMTLAERQAQAARTELVEASLAIVIHAQSLLLKIPGPASNNDELSVYLQQLRSYGTFDDAIAALRAIPAYRLPTFGTVSAVIKLPATVEVAGGIVRSMAALRMNPQGGEWRDMALGMEDLLNDLSEARIALENYLGRDDEARRVGAAPLGIAPLQHASAPTSSSSSAGSPAIGRSQASEVSANSDWNV